MIFVTGDTHGDFRRFKDSNFPQQKYMTKQDYVIICGDFGLWHDSQEQDFWLDWLDKKNYSTLFIDGNHENYDLLKTFPISEFCGGAVQYIRPSIIHLMRGQIYTIEEKRIFTMGGASCHDIDDGILSMDDEDFTAKKTKLNIKCGRYRIDHLNWWKEELPNDEEYEVAWKNLNKVNYEVDTIITHCPPEGLRMWLDVMGLKGYPRDRLTDFLERVNEKTRYNHWFFGHYHEDMIISEQHFLMYERIADFHQDDILRKYL